MTELEHYYHHLFISFARINTVILALPVIMAVLKWKSLDKTIKFFSLFVSLTLILNLIEHSIIYLTTKYYSFCKSYLDYWEIGDTSFFQIFYYLNIFILLTIFYNKLLPTRYSIWIKSASICFIIAIIINYLFIEGYKVFGTFNPFVSVAWAFIVPAIYLWYLFKNALHFPLNKNPYFWFSFGLIFASLMGLFLYLIGGFIHESNYVMFTKISITRTIFNMIAQIFLALGFWFAPYARFIPLPSQKHNERSV